MSDNVLCMDSTDDVALNGSGLDGISSREDISVVANNNVPGNTVWFVSVIGEDAIPVVWDEYGILSGGLCGVNETLDECVNEGIISTVLESEMKIDEFVVKLVDLYSGITGDIPALKEYCVDTIIVSVVTVVSSRGVLVDVICDIDETNVEFNGIATESNNILRVESIFVEVV